MSQRVQVKGLGPLALACLIAGAPACGKPHPTDEERSAFAKELAQVVREHDAHVSTRAVPRGQPPVAPSFGEAFEAKTKERAAIEESAPIATRCLAATVLAAEEGKCLAELAPSRGALDALLALSASERPSAPPSARALAKMAEVTTHRSLKALCSRAAVEIELQRLNAHPVEAALMCVKSLETARDSLPGGNLVGAMIFSACVTQLEEPCGHALDALDTDSARPRSVDIGAVVASLPPFADLADAELVGIEVPLCGWTMDAETRRSLGPEVVAAAARSDATHAAVPAGERNIEWTLCRNGFDALRLAASAYRSPKDSPRRAELLAKSAQVKVAIAPPDFSRYEETWEAAIAKARGLTTRPAPRR